MSLIIRWFQFKVASPIDSISSQELLAVLKKIETKGLLETARRTKQRCGQVFRHGIGIPPHLMKMKIQHIVPLSRQAIDVVRELLAVPLESRFLFPALGHPERPMSENTVGKALRIMGVSGVCRDDGRPR